MPFAVRDTVFQRLGKSRVDVNVSRNPNGNIDGIHPVYTHISFDQDMLGGVGRLTLRKLQSPALEDVLASLATAEVVLSSRGVAGRLNVPGLDELLFAG